MSKTLFALSIGLCCFVGCASEPDPPEVPYDAKSPRVMELRVLADEDRNREIVRWAKEQWAKEGVDKKPWTDLVLAPESKNPVARWVDIDSQAEAILLGDLKNIVRELPGDAGKKQILVILDPYNVTSDYVKRARPGIDQSGKPAVYFSLTASGAARFEKLTGSNLPQNDQYRHMGIIVENVLRSAPRIMTVISDSGQITGNFTEKEAERIAALMMARPAATK